jgi:hypothetical protein
MPKAVYRVDMPPIEVKGEGTSPTDEQMEAEQAARQEFIDALEPKIKELLERGPRRAGNVSRVELLGGNVWGELNQYLVLVSFDIGGPRIEPEEFFPAEAEVALIGAYADVQEWPAAE